MYIPSCLVLLHVIWWIIYSTWSVGLHRPRLSLRSTLTSGGMMHHCSTQTVAAGGVVMCGNKWQSHLSPHITACA